MSDSVKHECAVALLRLRKSPDYYARKYGTADYGFGKMALLLVNAGLRSILEKRPVEISEVE